MTHSSPFTIGVLICSYKRPVNLLRGLDALMKQERQPDDVLVIARHDDHATLTALALRRVDGLPLRVETVSEPGLVNARNAGLLSCRTDLFAITDDDTVPHPDWLARILARFIADPAVGGVGGRDWCHDGERFDDRSEAIVGRLQWFGRTIGNHHLGVGGAREVDFLKGANMSYRAVAVAGTGVDLRLRGSGSQPMEDLAFSCAVRRGGWKLIYDPLIAVDHYAFSREEPRHYAGVAATEDLPGLFDCAYNDVIALWESLRLVSKVAYVAWSILVGTGTLPGVVQAVRYTPRLGFGAWRRLRTVQRGKLAAVCTMYRRDRTGDAPPMAQRDASGIAS